MADNKEKKNGRPVRRELEVAQRATVPTSVQSWLATIDNREVRVSVALVAARYAGTHPVTIVDCWNFIEVCRSQGARPFEDVHLVKYDRVAPAQPVYAYTFLMARAKVDPHYNNFELWFVDAKGKRISEGLETAENIVAAICMVKNKKRDPVRFVARRSEFDKKQAMWNSMPVHMLGKVAIAGAHRLADPGNLGGMHIAEEFGTSEEEAARVRPEEAVIEAEIVGETPAGEALGEKGSPKPQDAPGEAQTPAGGGDTPTPPPAATAEAPEAGAADVPGPWADDFEPTPESPKQGKGKPKADPKPKDKPPEQKSEAKAEAKPEAKPASGPAAEPEKQPARETDVEEYQRHAEELLAEMDDEAVLEDVRLEMTKRFGKQFAKGKAWASEILGKPVTKMGDLPPADFRKLLLHIWVEKRES